jgi:hypothetical protein
MRGGRVNNPSEGHTGIQAEDCHGDCNRQPKIVLCSRSSPILARGAAVGRQFGLRASRNDRSSIMRLPILEFGDSMRALEALIHPVAGHVWLAIRISPDGAKRHGRRWAACLLPPGWKASLHAESAAMREALPEFRCVL